MTSEHLTFTNYPLGRLAHENNYARRALGKLIIVETLKGRLEVVSNHIGAVAVIVKIIEEKARNYFQKVDLLHHPTSGKIFMSMKTIGIVYEVKWSKINGTTKSSKK